MSLTAGARLGAYEIVAPLGAGGMGEVYRAKDTRLPRDAAIKVSAQTFGDRFAREAKIIASLNHPNICTLRRGTEAGVPCHSRSCSAGLRR